MADRFVGQPVFFVPGRRSAVQIRGSLATLVLQADTQQVGEQLVVAPPPAFFVQGDQEETRRIQSFEHLLPIRFGQ